MPDKAWKAFERRIAESLGTVRTPLSGGASRHTRSDTLHPDLFVECRQRGHSAICSWFRVTRLDAKKEKKVPVMALHQSGSPYKLAVIDWEYFLQLRDCYLHVAAESGWPDGNRRLEGKE